MASARTDSIRFPAKQTYSDGTVVHWDQAALPGGGEPEFPAPELTMTGAKAEPADDHQMPTAQTPATTDDSARWLAGGALVVAAVAVVATLLVRRRS